jgi:hypothetical protein
VEVAADVSSAPLQQWQPFLHGRPYNISLDAKHRIFKYAADPPDNFQIYPNDTLCTHLDQHGGERRVDPRSVKLTQNRTNMFNGIGVSFLEDLIASEVIPARLDHILRAQGSNAGRPSQLEVYAYYMLWAVLSYSLNKRSSNISTLKRISNANGNEKSKK